MPRLEARAGPGSAVAPPASLPTLAVQSVTNSCRVEDVTVAAVHAADPALAGGALVVLRGPSPQRVAIARAIAERPTILLGDEPTGASDAVTGALVLGATAQVNQDLGPTTAVITNRAAIAAIADRVRHLADGRIAAERRNERRAAPEALRW